DGVFGAGIFVEFTNIQELIVYAAEGNDQIWVLGTPVGASVRVVGGLGSDTVHLGGSPDDIEVTEYDANGVVTGSRIESFAPVTDFTDFHGPLLIDGGIGDGVPPLEPGVGLPGEITSPLPAVTNPNINVIEEDQVDLMFAHNTGT